MPKGAAEIVSLIALAREEADKRREYGRFVADLRKARQIPQKTAVMTG